MKKYFFGETDADLEKARSFFNQHICDLTDPLEKLIAIDANELHPTDACVSDSKNLPPDQRLYFTQSRKLDGLFSFLRSEVTSEQNFELKVDDNRIVEKLRFLWTHPRQSNDQCVRFIMIPKLDINAIWINHQADGFDDRFITFLPGEDAIDLSVEDFFTTVVARRVSWVRASCGSDATTD